MNYRQLIGLACLIATNISGNAQATALDLSGFAPFESITGSVTESVGTITFSENPIDGALYYFNDNFAVPANATFLSFDYDFQPGTDDTDDYLLFNINYVEQWQTTSVGAGHFVFDMTPYTGQTISLDWGLIEGGDNLLGASGTIFNIDLASTPFNPVPEPQTLLLVGTGLAGLVGLRRKKQS